MKAERQIIKIAEACGWMDLREFDSSWGGETGVVGTCPRYLIHSPLVRCYNENPYHVLVPDYLNDLNAMHEAEKILSESQWIEYADHLYKLAPGMSGTIQKRHIHATAEQRAEAFLKTLGLWE